MGKFCVQCGAPHGDEGKFCSACGAPFPVVGATSTPPAPAPVAEPPPPAPPAAAAPPPPAAAAPPPPAAAAAAPPPPVAAAPPPPVGPPGPGASAPTAPPGAGSPADGSSFTERLKHFAVIDWVHLGAVVVTLVSVYLPWLRSPNDSVNAMDVPAVFLISDTATDRGIELGILVLVCAGIALAAFIVRSSVMTKVLLGAAIALIVMGVLFIYQLNGSIGAAGISLTEILGLGPIVQMAAGAALVYVGVQRGKASPPAVGS